MRSPGKRGGMGVVEVGKQGSWIEVMMGRE